MPLPDYEAQHAGEEVLRALYLAMIHELWAIAQKEDREAALARAERAVVARYPGVTFSPTEIHVDLGYTW